jgi:hypothetical protein
MEGEMRAGFILALALAGFCAGEAAACEGPAPPLVAKYEGETQQQYNDRYTAARQRQDREEVERQQREKLGLWDRSLNVALAEVVESVRDVEISGYGKLPRVKVRLIAPLKGAKVTGEAELKTVTVTTCGPVPVWDVLGGEPGQRFVLFLSRDQFDQPSVVGSTAVANLSDTRVLEALAKLVR